MANGTSLGAPNPVSSGIHLIYINYNTGNDTTGTGAIGAPYKTLNKARSVAVAGDIIFIRGGDYGVAGGENWQEFFDASGSSGNPITIQNYPGETVSFWQQLRIDTSSYLNLKADRSGGGGWVFKTNNYTTSAHINSTLGAAVTTTSQTSITLSSWPASWSTARRGIRIGTEIMRITAGVGTTSLTVERGYLGTTPSTYSNGATVYLGETQLHLSTGDHIDVDGLEFTLGLGPAILVQAFGVQIRNYYVHENGTKQNEDPAVWWQVLTNAANTRNLIANGRGANLIGNGIMAYNSAGQVDTVAIVNNDMYNCYDSFQIASGTGTASGKNITIKNNIAKNSQNYGYRTVGGSGSTGIVLDTNLAHGTVGQSFGATAGTDGDWNTNTTNTVTDPLFVDASNKDFRIQNSSPAKNAAVAAWAPVYDASDNFREVTPDIGAFEYVQSLYPISNIASGTWSPSDGVSPLYQMIDEAVANDADYIYETAT